MKLDGLRGLVRPVLTLAFALVILALAFILALKYGDAEMAKNVVGVVLTSAGIIIAFWFGQRKAS